MAFLPGLKKQLNKANQFMTEKLGATEGTKLTEEYTEMEKKTDALVELMNELVSRTQEYLQPNPATRTKLMVTSKVVTSKTHAYPQPEGTLGEAMVRAARRLSEPSGASGLIPSIYADSLNEAGEALKQMSEVKYALEDNVKQNFLEPLTQLQNKDVRDVQFHRKKLEGRRLDYDCKRRRATGLTVTPADMKAAEEKFEESFNLASQGMFNLLQNESEQISQLAALSEALFEYHSQCASILESLTQRLIQQKELAAEKPVSEYRHKTLADLNIFPSGDDLAGQFAQLGGQPPQQQQRAFNGSSTNYFSQSAFYTSSSVNSSGVNRSQNAPRNASMTQQSHQQFPPQLSQRSVVVVQPQPTQQPPPQKSNARSPVQRGPCCQALYDFEAENAGELAFKEGDIITLMAKIDDNWFQGQFNGKIGMFPVTYVQVLVPLGQQ